MKNEEIVAWLREKDPYIIMDLERLMREDQYPVILSEVDYDFYLECMDELRRIQNAIKELLKNG